MSPDPGAVAWVVFLVFGAVSLLAAIGMTLTMSMYRAGLALMVSFLALAVLFFQLDADLLAVIQVMMNVAGMSVMILFMVMLMVDPGGEMMWDMSRQMRLPGIGALKMGMPRRREGDADDPHTKMMVDMAMSTGLVRWALAISIAVTALLVAVVARQVWPVSAEPPRRDSIDAVGELLLAKYMIAFEGAALLILAGIVTAVMLGRREAADRARAVPATAAVAGGHAASTPLVRASEHAHDASGRKEADMADKQYACPMHPDVTSDKPGKCPKCGMDLVAK